MERSPSQPSPSSSSPPPRNPTADAMQWVSRITSVGLMMVLPIWGGGKLDERLGTQYWALIGLVVGLAIGMWQIVMIAVAAKQRDAAKIRQKKTQPPSSDSEPLS